MDEVPPETFAKISDAIARAKEFKLCLRRIWAVAAILPDRAKSLPSLIPTPGLFSVPGHDRDHHEHEQCTFDFCEHSRVDFTSVAQLHESCHAKSCGQMVFFLDRLNDHLSEGKPTAWKLDGQALLDTSHSYMAISHVWADGTGTGTWGPGKVNKCLYKFFSKIAQDFQCEGIWWDTISIPQDAQARAKALNTMHSNYADARITLVHDLYLREWEWIDAETACFAIVMSPWFSRGWTSLELAMSHKVKILFKAKTGTYLIKDLDVDILDKITPSTRYHGAAESIRKLRKVTLRSLNEVLAILGSRDTSRPRDVPIISGLLAGVDVSGGLSQQEIYQRILRKLGNVAQGHLFHNSATMSALGFSWCPTNILDMPLAEDGSEQLKLQENGDLVGVWRVYSIDDVKAEDLIWKGTHQLTRVSLESALGNENKMKHLLLVELNRTQQDRALLVRLMGIEKATPAVLCCHFVGPLYFRSVLDGNGKEAPPREASVRIGDAEVSKEPIPNAWKHLSTTVPVKVAIKTSSKDTAAIVPDVSSAKSRAFLDEGGPASLDSKPWRALYYCERKGWELFFDTSQEHLVIETAGNMLLHFVEGLSSGNIPGIPRALWYGTKEMWSESRSWFSRVQEANANEERMMLLTLDENDKIKEQPERTTDRDALAGDALLLAAERANRHDVEPLVRLLLQNRAPHRFDVSGKTPLYLAVEHSNVAIVKKLLAHNSKPKYVGQKASDGCSAIQIAAKQGNEEIAKLLAEKINSNDLNEQAGKSEWTALHFAADGGFTEIVRLLLHRGADPNVQDSTGLMPLHCAAQKGHGEVLKILLEHGVLAVADERGTQATPVSPPTLEREEESDNMHRVKKDVGNNYGQTALHLAAEGGHESAVDTLLNYGAKVSIADNHHQTALLLAARNGFARIVQELLRFGQSFDKQECNKTLLMAAEGTYHKEVITALIEKGLAVSGMQDSVGMTALHYAIQARDEKNALLLIETQENLNMLEDAKKRTALMMAADNGLEEAVAALLKGGVDVNLRDLDDRTALHLAAIKRNVGVIKALVGSETCKPDFKATDYLGRTALHWAAVSGSGEATRILLKADDYHIIKDHYLRTALILAAGNGQVAAVKVLLGGGADPTVRDKDGKTALQWAATIGSDEVVRAFFNHPLVSDDAKLEALDLAVGGGHLSVAMSLQEHIEDPEHRDSAIPKVLFCAASAEQGNPAVENLIKSVINPNHQDARGKTALMLAIENENWNLTKALIRIKANTNLQDEKGMTALMMAARKSNLDAIELLLDHRAEVDPQDHRGYTALRHSTENNSYYAFLLLLYRRANPNIRDTRGQTVLHIATINTSRSLSFPGLRSYRMFAALRGARAKPDLQDDEGRTALHYAVRARRGDIADQLLVMAADKVNLDLPDREGRTPLLLAVESGDSYLVDLLLSLRHNPNCQDETRQSPLLLAAANGDESSVQSLLSQGAKPDLSDAQGRTALALAAQNNHKSIVKLLSNAASPNAQDIMDRTPLSLAAENGHLDVVTQLLEKNGNSKIVDKDGKRAWQRAMDKGHALVVERLLEDADTVAQDNKAVGDALLLASRKGWNNLVKVLLNKGANVAFRSAEGWTALQMAAMRGHQKVAKLLIERGVSSADGDRERPTALILATLHGFESIVRLLLERPGVKPDVEGWEGSKALLFAVEKGYVGIAKLLLDNGVECNVSDSTGKSAVILAAANGNEAIVTLLLERGANPATRDNYNRTALHHAAWGGYGETVKTLLNNKHVKPGPRDRRGESALHLAAERAAVEVIQQLLDKRANPNAASDDGQTSLHRAAWGGSYKAVELLCDYGADPLIADKSSNKPWQVGAEKGHEAIVEKLLEQEKSVRDASIAKEKALIFVAQMGYAAIARSLLDKGAEAGDRDERGRTALHWAAERGDMELVKLLMSQGKDSINILDREDYTALALGVQKHRVAVVRELLRGRANADTRGRAGQTALHMAAYDGNFDIVQILVEHSADPHVRDDDGKKAWQLAAERGFHEIVDLLLNKEVDLNSSSQRMNELLLKMVEHDHIAMVKLLLERHVDVNARDRSGRVAACLAAERGKDTVLEVLLEHGADVGIPDIKGQTPLLWAAKSNNIKIMGQILEHATKHGPDTTDDAATKSTNEITTTNAGDGPEPNGNTAAAAADIGAKIINYANTKKRTALMIAADNNHDSAVRLLLDKGRRHIDINAGDISGRTALHMAAEKGNAKLVELLLDSGANQSIKDNTKRTALLLAAEHEQQTVVAAWLKKSTKYLDEWGADKRTALLVATERGKTEMVSILLEAGADVNHEDKRRRTALLLATENGNKPAVDLLLQYGAKQQGKDNAGRTPLLLAIANGDQAIVETLLSRPDADLNAKDNKNRDALSLAAESANKDVAWLIVKSMHKKGG